MDIKCTNCGCGFNKAPSQINKSKYNNHFCSRTCAAKYNNHFKPKRKVEGNCKICNKPISTRKTTCSAECKEKTKEIKLIECKKYKQTKEQRRETNKKAVTSYRQKMKLRALEHMGNKCQVCGYQKSIRAMCFHHIVPSEKDFSFSRVTRKWETVKLELAKCILLCNRCHAEVHDGLLIL